jgi:hypothetical protein
MVISYIDTQIITLRKNNSRIGTILKWVVKQRPNLDEQLCLSRILNTLDDNGLTYTRIEVRKAFMIYYNQKNHGESRGYINWLMVGRKNHG